MNTTSLRNAFFEDLGCIEDDALRSTHEAIAGAIVPPWVSDANALSILRETCQSTAEREALARFVAEMVHIALHSVLVAVDGGAASAEHGRLHLVDEAGESLGEGLHELYSDYLLETGRTE